MLNKGFDLNQRNTKKGSLLNDASIYVSILKEQQPFNSALSTVSTGLYCTRPLYFR